MAEAEWRRRVLWFAAASVVVVAGVGVAAARFPGGFDWFYTVISRLGSSRHNPDGAVWLSGSLLAAVCLLWPVTGLLRRGLARVGAMPRLPIAALRVGLIGAGLLAVEGLLVLDLSRLARKGHEILALTTFLGLYAGVLGLCVHRIRHTASAAWPAVIVVLPLCAVGISQLALYFDQRDLGWVNTAWREMGIPLWLSFAFWQWLAVAFLGIGLGYVVAARDPAPRRGVAGASRGAEAA